MTTEASMMSPELIAKTTAPLEEARHIPGSIYSSQEVFDLEKERLFMTDWLFVGRVEELPNAGDYLSQRIMGESILVTRDKEGDLRAFFNTCLHRGVELALGTGNCSRFVCPYHAWTYDLQGKLIGAPFMKESKGFDTKECRLKPVQVDTWAGNIFINMDSDAEPLNKTLEFYQGEFEHQRQEELVLAYKLEVDFACNWKLVYENLLDIYHVGTTHAGTIGRFHDEDSYKVKRGPDGALSINYDTQTMTPDGKTRFGAIPWLEHRGERFAEIGFMPPNLTLLARYDFVRPIVHWPIAPDKTHSVAYYLFPKSALEDPQFDEKIMDYVDYGKEVLDEDAVMIVSLQRAMASKTFVPGRMSTFEHSLHHVIGNHLERVFGETSA